VNRQVTIVINTCNPDHKSLSSVWVPK